MFANLRGKFRDTAAFAAFTLVLAVLAFMMFGSSGTGGKPAYSASGKWTCSMCPQFILPEPGKCPKCFMDLIPLAEGAGGGSRLELRLSPRDAELAGITTETAEAVPAANREDARLRIPGRAILTSRGRHVVFVESMDGDGLVYAIREIRLSGRDGESALVASGLDEGEMVAATGAFRIDSAMQILGKVSLVNLPDGELSDAAGGDPTPYQPAVRSGDDIRTEIPDIDAWFGRYEQIRGTLARNANGEAERPAREFAAFLAAANPTPREDLSGTVSRLAESARALSGAGSLEAKRMAFEDVTADMVLLARRFGSPAGGLNLVFCPMAFGGAGAYWLQPGDVVDNPYHGLEMPLCGWMVDSIPPFAPPSPSGQE